MQKKTRIKIQRNRKWEDIHIIYYTEGKGITILWRSLEIKNARMRIAHFNIKCVTDHRLPKQL